tara:strand:- start:63 stop:2282 length:2220 start_codon:yes stop_codon:yes gene_type:complete
MSKDNWLNPLNSISQVYSEQIASQTKKELKDLEKGIKKLSDKDIAKADKVAEVVDETYYSDNTRGVSTKGGLRTQYNKPGKLSQSSFSHERKSKKPELRMSKKELRKSMVDDATYEKKMGRSKPTPSNLKTSLKKMKKEGLYNWRDELREIADDIPMTDKESEKKVKERKVNNKVIINPKMSEAFEGIGGSVLAVGEFDTVEAAVEYFYEEGINEEGLDQIIEEVGLEEFVEFITESAVELNEERAARKARASAPSYEKVKAQVDAADAAKKKAKKGEYSAAYRKKETDVTVYDDKPAKKKAVSPVQKMAKRRADDDLAGAPLQKKPKVVKAVAKVKKTQPAKKPSKQGLRDRITTAYKKGVERHKAARERGRVPEKRAKEFGKGVVSGVKTAVKAAKDVKKAVVGEEVMDEANKAERIGDKYSDRKLAHPRLQRGKRASKKSTLTARLTADVGQRNRNRFSKSHGGDGSRKLNKFGSDYQTDSVSKDGRSSTQSDHAQKQRRAEHEARRGVKTKGVKEAVVGNVDEAKVDAGKSPETKEKDRNVRKFGVSHNVVGHGKLRRALHRSNRGDKKIPGDKPYVEMEAKVDTGSPEAKASARNVRNTPPGKDSKFDTSVFITRKPGESLDSARTRKRREAHAAKRGGSHNRSSSQGQMMSGKSTIYKEDKAFNTVVAALRKKHGNDAVLTTKDDFEKMRKRNAERASTAKQIQRKDERSAAQREVDAQYGRTPWNKKGSLGT